MNPFVPHPAEIIEKRRDTKNIFTYRLRFCDEEQRKNFRFQPGQFNMLYVFGKGDVAISIVSDPEEPELMDHTIRIVGTVTNAIGELKKGDILGVRGPFGSSWPLEDAKGKDILVVTGGLGCAPVVSVIQYIFKHRTEYGNLKILHGIKSPRDLLYQKKFREWEKSPNTEVYLSSDTSRKSWKYNLGVVTNLIQQIQIQPERTVAMMCGPERMMRFAIKDLFQHGLQPDQIYLALERNMKCALGFCGHCQFGPKFICKDGPVLRYDRIKEFFNIKEV